MMTRVLLSAVLLAGTDQANALTLTSSFSNPLEVTEVSQTGLLSLFDSQLGTLTGATLTISGAMDSSLTMTSRSTVPVSAIGSFSLDLGFGSDNAAVHSQFNNFDDLALGLSTGLQTLAPGASYTASTTPAASYTTASYDLSAILASLSTAGGGSFGLSCASSAGMGVQGGGGQISTSQSTQAACGASISYLYESFAQPGENTPPVPVPEAGSQAFMAFGLLGMAGLFLQRRRSPRV